MAVLKILGVTALVLSFAGIGMSRAAGYLKRLVFLRQCRTAVEIAAEHIVFYRTEIRDAYSPDSVPPSASEAATAIKLEFEGVNKLDEYKFLTRDDKRIIREYAASLGSFDASGEKERSEMFLNRIDRNITSAASDSTAKTRLSVSLWSAAGLCVALLVI